MVLKHLLEAICFEALWQWAAPGLLAQGAPLDRIDFLKGTLPVQVMIWQVPTMLQHGCVIQFTVAAPSAAPPARKLEIVRH